MIEDSKLDDTDPHVRDLIDERLRQMSPEEKLGRINRLCAFGRQMMMNNIKAQAPGANQEELKRLFAVRVLGQELAERAFP